MPDRLGSVGRVDLISPDGSEHERSFLYDAMKPKRRKTIEDLMAMPDQAGMRLDLSPDSTRHRTVNERRRLARIEQRDEDLMGESSAGAHPFRTYHGGTRHETAIERIEQEASAGMGPLVEDWRRARLHRDRLENRLLREDLAEDAAGMGPLVEDLRLARLRHERLENRLLREDSRGTRRAWARLWRISGARACVTSAWRTVCSKISRRPMLRA